MNRILIRLYVPRLEKKYDIWIPINKTIYTVVNSFIIGINSLNKVTLDEEYIPNLYNKETSEIYELDKKIIDTNIRNGSELILF